MHGRMVVVRDIEPWDELLEAGRTDERLVTQSAVNARPGHAVADPRGAAPRGRRGAARRAASSGCGPTRPRRSTRRGPGRRSSRPARRRASRCASSCRRSTCSAATRARARSTSTPPRRSRRTRRARCNALGVDRARPAIYDGDTPREQRAAIRRNANVVLTNPDMLHLGILPNHPAWATSSPTSRSSWSTRRTCTAACSARTSATCCGDCAGSRAPTGPSRGSCMASATIANPGELAERLTGLEDFTVIERDGSPGHAAHDRDVEPADHRREARHAPLRALRGRRPAGRARRRRARARSCS